MARTLTLNKTYAQMQALIASNGLDTQTFYKITDRGDRGLLFRAAATNKLESEGLRYMLCPATYKTDFTDDYNNHWQGVWHSELNASLIESDLVLWNGLVWLTGATLSGDSPDTEGSGFTLIPKASFTNHEYIEMVFGVTYDFENDWIRTQCDGNGNVLGMSKSEFILAYEIEGNPTFNVIDYCDWNIGTSGNELLRNSCRFIYNNSNGGSIKNNVLNGSIFNNSNTEGISDNICKSIYGNSNAGQISENINSGTIDSNTINGNITGNINRGAISSNSSLSGAPVNIALNNNNGEITGVWDADVTDPVVNKTGTAE